MLAATGGAASALIAGPVGAGASSRPTPKHSVAARFTKGEFASKHWVIGFTNPTGGQAILDTVQQTLIDQGKFLGIKVIALNDQLSPTQQLADVKQLTAEHVNGIITFPLAPGTLNPALSQARSQGIKVLGFNAIVDPRVSSRPYEPAGSIAPYNASFDQNENYEGASQLSAYVDGRLHGKGNILGIGIQVPVPSLQLMLKQYRYDVTKGHPGIHWLETVYNPTDNIAGGRLVTEEAITKFHGNIQAVMAYNDDSAIGAAVALRHAGINTAKVVIVGQNGDPEGVQAIKDGQMSMMMDIVPWREGLIGMKLMISLLQGHSLPKVTYVPIDQYTKATIHTMIPWQKAVNEIAVGTLQCSNGGC